MKLNLSKHRAPVVPPRPYVGEELVSLPTDAGDLWIPKNDGVMKPYIEREGTWEPEEGALLRQYFKPGLRFVDAGANVGYFSLLVAKECPGAQIHAFEPHPMTSQILALNAWASAADITVHALALSAGDRVLALSSAPTNLGDTRTTASGSGTSLSPAAPYDEIVPDGVIDLLKIDVQGFEPEVLAGMAAALRRSPDVVIVSEFWPSALRERGLDPLKVLRRYRDQFHLQVQVGEHVSEKLPIEILRICDAAGPAGQVNLLMTQR